MSNHHRIMCTRSCDALYFCKCSTDLRCAIVCLKLSLSRNYTCLQNWRPLGSLYRYRAIHQRHGTLIVNHYQNYEKFNLKTLIQTTRPPLFLRILSIIYIFFILFPGVLDIFSMSSSQPSTPIPLTALFSLYYSFKPSYTNTGIQ